MHQNAADLEEWEDDLRVVLAAAVKFDAVAVPGLCRARQDVGLLPSNGERAREGEAEKAVTADEQDTAPSHRLRTR